MTTNNSKLQKGDISKDIGLQEFYDNENLEIVPDGPPIPPHMRLRYVVISPLGFMEEEAPSQGIKSSYTSKLCHHKKEHVCDNLTEQIINMCTEEVVLGELTIEKEKILMNS